MNSMLLTFPFNFPTIKNVIAKNEFSGSIPTEIGLTNLTRLWLSKQLFLFYYHAAIIFDCLIIML